MAKKDKDIFSNKAVVQLLHAVATAYELKGENRFKVIAYQKAAETVDHLVQELKDVWREGKLQTLPSLGPAISQHLDEYFSKGSSKHFNEVLGGVPQSVFVLLNVPGIGPKKAFKLVHELKLTNPKTIIQDLEHAAQKNKIAQLETFGEKSQNDILQSLTLYKQYQKRAPRMNLAYANELAQTISTYLKQLPHVKRVDALGSLRRGLETIGDIDIAVATTAKNPQAIIKHFTNYPNKLRIEEAGERKATIIIPPHTRVDLRVQGESTYGSMLQYFTGSKEHNIKLREYALHKGYSLSEYGITNTKTKKLHTFADEESFYKFLGLSYIPPEIREGKKEIKRAGDNIIAPLVELSDIKGDLHTHSSYDLKPSHDFGENSYEELIEAALKQKYKYIGFADHNPKLSGHSAEDIVRIMRKRYEHIHKTLKKYTTIRYFIGLEVDIMPEGKLSLPEQALPFVDYLIASVHSSFRLDVRRMTERVLKALSFPKVRILGHPTGRLINKRDGFTLDWEKIFEHCKKKHIALEINASPERMDLPAEVIEKAQTGGVPLIINTDTHRRSHLENMRFGVINARRGWCEKKHIVNTLPARKFAHWILSH